MARVRDIDRAIDEENPFLRLKQRAKRHEVKTTKATEALVENLVEQNKKLSTQVMLLRKLLKGVYRILPASLKVEYESIKASLDSLEDFEVHP